MPGVYLTVVAAAGVAAVGLALYAGGQRRYPGFAHFALTQLAIAAWIFCYLGEHLDAPRAAVWFTVKFPAVAAIPPSWLLFAWHHVGGRPRVRVQAALYAWPVLLGPILLTEAGRRLMFRELVRGPEIVGVAGPLFVFHLALSYATLAVAETVLFRDWRRRRAWQSGLLGIGGLVPLAGAAWYQAVVTVPALGPLRSYDTTLPAFALSALFTGWAALRYRLLDPRPAARDALFEWLPDVVLVLNERGAIVDANHAALALLGRRGNEVLGRDWEHVFAGTAWSAPPAGADDERPWTREGREAWYELQRRPLAGRGGATVGAIVVGRDVTSRRRIEDELRAESRRDGLTGLSNRRHFDDEASRLRRSREFPVAVFAFDLDDLKAVNDREGHSAGDDLLRAMAAFLTRFFRAGDRVFRMGGDEFLVLLPATSADEADRVLERLPDALARFDAAAARALRFSSGAAVAVDAATWATALALADERLYEAKRSRGAGRGTPTQGPPAEGRKP
ncbi:MAG: diguanylate cyclase [Vicinamibacteria bacterium]